MDQKPISESGHIDLSDAVIRERVARLFRYAQIGQCVNSVTHDVNNYLGAIMAYAELVGLEASISNESRRMLGEIVNAVRRSSTLVGNLTDVARKERPDVRIMLPDQLVERVLDLRRYDIKVINAQIDTCYEEGISSIAIDLPKMEQALIYLVANAIEAVEGCETRRIRLAIHSTEDAVVITFWNSGPTVQEAHRETIFDRFFTTKDGLHLGLGLPISREVAQYHGGTLTYDPETGFVMTIPKRNQLSQEQGMADRRR